MTKPTKPAISQNPVPPPQRGEPRAIFATKANNYILWQINALYPYNAASVTYMDAAMDYTALQADEAQAQASIATTQADIATQQAEIASSVANYQGLWSNLTGAYSLGITVGHNDKTWRLDVDVADITLSEPSVSGDWTDVTPLTITQSPTLSASTVTINENSSTGVTITDYDSRLDYTATPVDSNIAAASITGNTITITGGDITDGLDKQTVVNVTAKTAGILASDPVAITVNVIYVPIVADDAIQVVDFSGEELFNDGFDQV